jgi:hypothetical protein
LTAEGTFDEVKMRENMEFAAEDAAQRIRGTPYGGHKFSAYVAPDEKNCVVGMSTKEKIQAFLKKDSADHRRNFNFIVKPDGPLWQKIFEL